MDTYYLHDYNLDGTEVRLVYLRKAEGIDPQSRADELDAYLKRMITRQYPGASENIEIIASLQDVQKWDAMLLQHRHLTANFRCATIVPGFTFITVNYASILIPMDVPTTMYESVGRHGSMRYEDYNRLFFTNASNPPLLLHQHPAIHGIACYREYEAYPSPNPEVVYFMYHHNDEYVRAEVKVNDGTALLSYSSNRKGADVINEDLYNLKNGNLMSLSLNREKALFKTAKHLVLDELAKGAALVNRDFEKYLLYADEL